MRHVFPLLYCLILTACSTQWQRHTDSTNTPVFKLQATRTSTLPAGGLRPIGSHELQAGDILFSAEPGIASIGVRLFNHASVSHAFIYLGEGQIAEAIGSGVQIHALDDALRTTTLAVAFRRPGLTESDIDKIRSFARQQEGRHYNFTGIAKQIPYSLTRHACDLPVIPQSIRRLCMNALAVVQITPFSSDRFFCSQFVVEAFNRAGKPLTDTEPEWVSPADILHMREGDIFSVTPITRLQYIGHLQCRPSPWNMKCTEAPAVD